MFLGLQHREILMPCILSYGIADVNREYNKLLNGILGLT